MTLTKPLAKLSTTLAVAVMDLGTNTIILLIAEIDDRGNYVTLVDDARVVRLGEGINEHRKFLPQAMERAYAALMDFKSIIDRHDCEEIRAVGTAGFRNAENSSQFIARVADELEIDIQVISGEREAELIYLATKTDFDFLNPPYLTVDIGGGSTEFVLDDAKSITAKSLPIGSVKLTERFIRNDPPLPEELAALDAFIREELKQIERPAEPPRLIATAGTATTLAALSQQLAIYIPEKVHRSTLTIEELEKVVKQLEGMDLNERKKLPGMTPLRADVITAGGHLLLETARAFGIDKMWISDRGLRYGVLYDALKD